MIKDEVFIEEFKVKGVYNEEEELIGMNLKYTCPSILCQEVVMHLSINDMEWIDTELPYETKCPQCKRTIRFYKNKYVKSEN